MGRTKKRTKDYIEILRGGFRTCPPAHGGPSRRAVPPFPAHLCTRPRGRIRGSRARGTTTRTSGHDQRKAKAASHPRPEPPLSGAAAARHCRLSAHDRAVVRRTREIDQGARRGDALGYFHPVGYAEERLR